MASARGCWESDRRGLLVGFLVAATVHAGIFQQLADVTFPAQQVDMPPLVTLSLIAAPVTPTHSAPVSQSVARVERPAPVQLLEPIPEPARPVEPARQERVNKPPVPQPRDTPQVIASVRPPTAGHSVAVAQPLELPHIDAAYLRNPPPVYPKMLLKRGVEGRVLVRARVQDDGRCSQVTVKESSGLHLFDEAALVAVKNWQFVPARKGAQTVVAWVDVPIAFRITRTR